MKGVTYVMILGFVFLLGCENKQLVQCQKDLETVQNSCEKEKEISDQMLAKLEKEHQEEVETLQEAIQQAKVDEKAKHAKALKKSYARHADLTQSVLKLQRTVKQLKDEKEALESQLAEAKEQLEAKETKVTNSADMLQVLAAENAKLKAENAELKSELEE